MGCWPHPRLLYSQQTVERLREDIEQDAGLRAAWQRHVERADALLTAELISEEYADASESQHGNYGAPSGQISEMGLLLGLAYQVTGRTHYAAKLREALLHYSTYQKWYGKGLLKRRPPWRSELNTARFCFGFGVGYDAIYHFLPAEDRAVVAAAVTRLGILPTLEDWLLPAKRIHALDSMGHNWWSVCVSEAGLAALALVGFEPRAEEWVEAACRGLEEWFAYRGNVLQNKSPNFDGQGAFYESVNYANYALYEYLLFRLGYTNTYGVDRSPAAPSLDQAGRFFLDTCYPTATSLLTVNFGDGSLHGHAGEAVALLLANGYEDPRLRWYLARTGFYTSPLALLHCHRGDRARPYTLGTSAIYPDIGWAVMRSSWEDDATLLAVKSGFTWNHAHADAGSFIVFHAGQPLIIDSGNCSYGRPEYTGYYCQSRAHNVILCNGQGQSPEDIARGVKHSGRVHGLIEHEGLRYCYSDATGPTARYFQRNYRHFLWLDNVIIVIDDIRAHEPCCIKWLLHYGGEAAVTRAGVELANGPARALVRMLFPEHLTIGEEVGLADHRPDTPVRYLSFSPAGETREAKFITAIVLGSHETGEARLEPLQGPEMLGLRVWQGGKVTSVYLNLQADGRRMHQNSNNVIEGWETDAYLLALRRPEDAPENDPDALEHCFIACGSYLRGGGRVVFDSLSKADAAFALDGDSVSMVVQGQPLIRVAVRARRKPAAVTVNGARVEGRFSAASEVIRVALHGGSSSGY